MLFKDFGVKIDFIGYKDKFQERFVENDDWNIIKWHKENIIYILGENNPCPETITVDLIFNLYENWVVDCYYYIRDSHINFLFSTHDITYFFHKIDTICFYGVNTNEFNNSYYNSSQGYSDKSEIYSQYTLINTLDTFNSLDLSDKQKILNLILSEKPENVKIASYILKLKT